MTDTNGFPFVRPGTFADPLTEVLRAEIAALLSCHADKRTDDGRAVAGDAAKALLV